MSRRASNWIPCVLLALSAGCGVWRLETRGDPAEPGEAAARQQAPAFSLASDDGTTVSLDELLADGRPAVLVFYRGHW